VARGPQRQRLLEQMLALFKVQEELMLAQLNLMKANDVAPPVQAPGRGQAAPGVEQATAASSGGGQPVTCGEDRGMSDRADLEGLWRPAAVATAPTLPWEDRQRESLLEAAVKLEEPSPPLPDGQEEQAQGHKHKSWRLRDQEVAWSNFAEADPWGNSAVTGGPSQ